MWGIFVLVVAIASPVFAADPAIELTTRGNDTVTGRLTEWTADRLQIIGDAAYSIAPNEIFSLSFPEHSIRPIEGGWLILANGDRIAAAARRISDDKVEAQWTAAPLRPAWNGPLESVSAVVFNFPSAPRIRREWLSAFENTPGGSDQVQFITGDRVQGELSSLEGLQISVKTSFGATQLDRQRVRWLRLDRDLLTVPKLERTCWFVWLTDGSRLTANDVRPDRNLEVTLKLPIGGAFNVAWNQIARLQHFDEKLSSLSQRTPVKTNYKPYLSGERSLRRDRNVLGSPLVVRGTESAVGLGMMSAMSATYRIEPGDAEFRARVGIDDTADGRGSARFRVQLDGQTVWESDEITGRMPGVPVPAQTLTGHKELTLQVDFGNAGDVGDYADWCDAVIVVK